MPVRAADDDEASKLENVANNSLVIAGFFTGGALAIRGGAKAARNSAIGCACLLAVIEGVGIGFQRMMAENTRLDLPPPPPPAESGQTGFPAIA
ncbi:Mitochondrial import inner membrane translocase subunit tim17 [Lachnellula cervina]|uniref:Mitochondrial import inner membrane translocase subunit tim17 n=1 Tax=Lachnellula cervina TaxID=1316786 RepID=A0A7D8YTY7_9HELO|nr:Mitochondrial import inner membrane translocase subunit tim17 [Lachnellula cervina]